MAHQMPMETQQELRRLPGNNRCVDCDAPYPQWATVSYGTFMCLECSGRHRGLGVHISFVRSVTMDSWTDKQVQMMQQGGNDAFRSALAAAGVPSGLSIAQKYNTPQAEAYRVRLSALVEGRSLPPSLPQWDPSCIQTAASSSSSSSSFGGDSKGVEALKGESESDYVARQMRLRDEARARMQAKFGAGGMQGIGSSGETRAPPSAGGIPDLSSAFGYLTSTVSSVASTASSIVRDQDLGSKVSSGWSLVQSKIGDPALTDNVKSTATSGWSALSSGASAVWRSAQTVVESTVQGGGGYGHSSGAGFPSQFPRTNADLPATSKYSGMGNSRDHDNDSWLDAQLGGGGGSSSSSSSSAALPKASSFGGSASSGLDGGAPLSASSHSSSFTSSSTSSSAGMSLGASATPLDTFAPMPPTAPPAPVAAPVKPAKPVKKDVDFFGEFGA